MFAKDSVARVDQACRDMRRILSNKEGVDDFISHIRPWLSFDFAFILEGGGAVLADKEVFPLLRRQLAQCKKLRELLSPLEYKLAADASSFDTRTRRLFGAAMTQLYLEKRVRDRHLVKGLKECSSEFLSEALNRIGGENYSAKPSEGKTDSTAESMRGINDFLADVFHDLDELAEILDCAATWAKTGRGNPRGTGPNFIVKKRLANVFVRAYCMSFGHYPPTTDHGPAVDAFEMLCRAAYLPDPEEENYSYVLTKVVREMVKVDPFEVYGLAARERGKRVSIASLNKRTLRPRA